MTNYGVQMIVNGPEMLRFGTVLDYNKVTMYFCVLLLGIVSGG